MIAKRVVVIGGGPAGHAAATHAARLGAEVSLIERDLIGGSAHLLDCVPSKTMISTGSALSFANRLDTMGLADVSTEIDVPLLRSRIEDIRDRLSQSDTNILESQNVRILRGSGRLQTSREAEQSPREAEPRPREAGQSPHEVVADTADGQVHLEADVVVLATGSRPRIPDWADFDGERIMTTRDAYPPKEIPEHLVVVGSGVTGVEFVHMFVSLGSKVTLVVSRQQVLPNKDPEAAAALESTFLAKEVSLLKGARAISIEHSKEGSDVGAGEVIVKCNDGRTVIGSHALVAIGSVPNSEGLGLENTAVELDELGHIKVDHNLLTAEKGIYAAGDLSGKLPLSSVAIMQGYKIAEHALGMHRDRPHRHIDYETAASAVFTEPEIAEVGLAEAEAFASGRKILVTKVPFSSNAKALIDRSPEGFVKIVSDPMTGQVLGGCIVGKHAAEMISVLALAVTAELRVQDIAESLFVYPSLCEAISEAAK